MQIINETCILLCSKEAKEMFDIICASLNYRNIHSIKKLYMKKEIICHKTVLSESYFLVFFSIKYLT